MKKRLAAALLAVLTACSMSTAAFAAEEPAEDVLELTDIEEGMWYTDAVLFAVSYGLMDPIGEAEGQAVFSPSTPMPREQVAEAVYRFALLVDKQLAAGLSSTDADGMDDFDKVSAGRQAAVRYCYGAGIMTGDNKRMLNPQASISREEFAAVLQRFVKLYDEKGYMEGVAAADTLAAGSFTDQALIAAWAQPGVAFCKANALMNGNANGTFNPKGNISRAEMAQVLYNLAPEEIK